MVIDVHSENFIATKINGLSQAGYRSEFDMSVEY